MSGATVVKMPHKGGDLEKVTVTPAMAVELLERNGLNRPLAENHVKRIAGQIKAGKWHFNGDTIKISDTDDVLDGQHRLWAVIEAKKAVKTIIVRGIKREAFATIDTIRKPRSIGDTVALSGVSLYRNQIAMSLAWLLRWQRGVITTYRAPENRIENSDIEEVFATHSAIVQSVERCIAVRRLANTAIMAFLYYVISNRDEALAERMIRTMEDPSTVALSDPFFRFRSYFTADHHRRKEPIMTIALGIKAANATKAGKKLDQLMWRTQGRTPEAFPTLDF